MTSRTVIDLFSGGGGLSLGASRAGFSVHGAIELDNAVLDIHRRNFPSTTHINADIATLRGADLAQTLSLDTATSVTGIIGGPPCQGFSIIGKSHSGDPRNSLFRDFFRLVADIKPHFFLAENVPGILHAKNAHVWKDAVDQVAGPYVILPPLVIDASDYGAPTTRRRAFFVGYLRSRHLHLTHGSVLI